MTESTTQSEIAGTLPDPRPLLVAALDQAERLIAPTDAGAAKDPTPCEEWDVETMIGHVQAVALRIAAILSGRDPMTMPRVVEASNGPASWLGDWSSARSDIEAVIADTAVLERQVTVPWGTVTGAQAVGSYAGELSTHAWDLAVATGRSDELDDALATAILPAARAMIPAQPRGGPIPFGPVVEVGPDASAYEQLVAFEGRDPSWRPRR